MKIASGRSVDLVNDKDKVELLRLAWPASTGYVFPAGVIGCHSLDACGRPCAATIIYNSRTN